MKNKKSKNKVDKKYRQLQQISSATLLEESSHLRLILKGILAVAVLIVVLVVWSAFTYIKETAVSYGEVVPKGQVQLIQHLEGGIVSKVLVNNGERVTTGQLLIKLDPTATIAELDQLRSREISLVLDSQRLSAFISSQPANLVAWGDAVINSKYNPIKNQVQIDKLLKDQKLLLQSQYKRILDQEATIKNTIAQRQEKLKELFNQRKIWSKHIKLLTEEFNMYQRLKKNNYVSHKDYLTVLRAVNKAKGDGAKLLSEIEQTEELIAESQNKLKEIISEARETALRELSKINGELLQVRHKIEKLEDKLARTSVKSPITGTVKGVKVSAGNVLQPGGLILEIVPENTELVVESKIQPRDIGHIKVGDDVTVKILTYDFARYGSLKGKLVKISASTFTGEDERPYYKATVELDKQYIGSKKRKKYLRPGMTVEANVITGEKTLLQYMLKPIHRSTSQAFKER